MDHSAHPTSSSLVRAASSRGGPGRLAARTLGAARTRSRTLAILLAFAAVAPAQPDLASIIPLGEGTPGALGVPSLVATGLPAVGQPAFDLRILDGRPGTPAFVVAGVSAVPTPLPPYGATLWPGTPLVALTTTIGRDGDSLPLLATPGQTPAALAGATAVAQGVVVDATAQGGLAFTNGLLLAFGIGSPAAEHFDAPAYVLVPPNGRALAVGDLDGDGLPDVVTVSPLGGGVGAQPLLAVALATPGGPHLPLPPIPTGDSVVDLELADLDGDGALDAVVSHYAFGGPTQGRVAVHLGNGDGTFGPASGTLVGTSVGGLAIGDATGDGVLDVIVTRANLIVTLPGVGDGTFAPLVGTFVGFSGTVPDAVEAADVDGDGLLDVLVGTVVGGLHVLGGNGDGTFVERQVAFTGGSTADLAAGDVDADGDLDVVVVNSGDTTGTTTWLPGLGDGTLGAPITLAALSPNQASVALGDVTGDGLLDVVVTEIDPAQVFVAFYALRAGGVAVLPGLGAGVFGETLRVRAGDARELELADLDGDGDLDLVALVDGGAVVALVDNPGDGAFAMPAQPDPDMLGAIALDVDLDGVPDLVEQAADATGALGWRRGLGDGTFGPVASIATGIPLGGLVIAPDVTADGQADLLVYDGGQIDDPLHVLVGTGPAMYADAGAPIATDQFLAYVEVADLDGDGAADLTVLDFDGVFANRIRTWLGGGDGTFALAQTISPQQTLFGVAFGDVTGDGVLDMVTTPVPLGVGGKQIDVRPGAGDGTFGDPITTPIDLIVAQYPRLADLDGDGLLDVVVTSSELGRLLVARGLGDGTFAEIAEHACGRRPVRAEPLDVNGDGATDLVVPALEGAGVSVLLGFGDGGFGPAQPFGVGSLAITAQPSDLDLDGDVDLVVVLAAYAGHAVLLNAGGPGAP